MPKPIGWILAKVIDFAVMTHTEGQLLRRLYGRSAEKIDPQQLQLFETLLNQLAPPTSEAPPSIPPTSKK